MVNIMAESSSYTITEICILGQKVSNKTY